MNSTEKSEQKKLLTALLIPALFVILILNIQLIEVFFNLNLVFLGVLPRTLRGVKGIFFGPLIHGGFNHLFSNSIPLLLLGTAVAYFYPKSSNKVFALLYFVPSILVWIFARQAYHIGSSGIVYGLGSFLFFSGVVRRDTRAIVVSLLVVFLYGGLIWGIFPLDPRISFEAHFFGLLTGFLLAFVFRKQDPYKRYDWEDEEEDWDKNDLEIKYFKRSIISPGK